LPFSKRLGWIGVDVGTHTVKLAQAVRTAGGARLVRAAAIQRTNDWSSEDALGRDQPQPSGDEIRAALECGGFWGRNAICAAPMNVCELRGLNVPPGTEHERRTIIGDELAAEWSERGMQVEFDFWELEAGKAEKGSDVFNVNVLAAPRPWVLQLARDCRSAGLDCWAVDGLPLALARSVGLAGGVPVGGRVLAVDWGYSNTTLCVVGDNRPLYARRIHGCAFGKVLDAIGRVFGVTLDEAQHLADTQGVVPADGGVRRPAVAVEATHAVDHEAQAAITDAAEETIDELARQIGRTLHFMESQRRHLQPSSIWLMGGGASMNNIGPRLAEQLRMAVHIWQIPADGGQMPWAAGPRAAVFAQAAALSALGWLN
jgi:Tfp pilus assembly PilM family ATPase